jgi:hypothetical protein
MRDGGVDGESANSRRVLESLVFRPILPGPPPLGVHLFASIETLVWGKLDSSTAIHFRHHFLGIIFVISEVSYQIFEE